MVAAHIQFPPLFPIGGQRARKNVSRGEVNEALFRLAPGHSWSAIQSERNESSRVWSDGPSSRRGLIGSPTLPNRVLMLFSLLIGLASGYHERAAIAGFEPTL